MSSYVSWPEIERAMAVLPLQLQWTENDMIALGKRSRSPLRYLRHTRHGSPPIWAFDSVVAFFPVAGVTTSAFVAHLSRRFASSKRRQPVMAANNMVPRGSMSRTLLRELGIAPTSLGALSPCGIVQAVNVAEVLGCKVFPGTMTAAATNDLGQIGALHREHPEASWFARSAHGDGLLVLYAPRDRDVAALSRDMGRPPATLLVSRANSATTYFWFRAGPDTPHFTRSVQIHGTRAELKNFAPLPGSIHPPSGERFAWVAGRGPGQTELLPLPPRWHVNLPRVDGVAITLAPVHKHEWRANPNSPLWTGP